jgi:hypothetical protein
MLYAITKALLSGAIIATASEVAKRNPGLGAIILSLPLVSLLAFVWLWLDTGDKEAIATLSRSTFWFVLLTLPMFLLLPALLRNDMSFWLALVISCSVTATLYLVAAWAFPKVGIVID